MEEEEKSRNAPLKLDWSDMLGESDAEPPPELIIEKKTIPEYPKPCPMIPNYPPREDIVSRTDKELEDSIRRQRATLEKLSCMLPDKGEKIRAHVRALEDERNRRRSLRQKEGEECQKPTQSTSSGASDGFRQENVASQINSRSEFASIFNKKMDEDRDHGVVNAFDKELTILDSWKRQNLRSVSKFPQIRRQKHQSRHCAPIISGNRCGPSTGDLHGRASLSRPLYHNGESMSSNSSKKNDTAQVLPSTGPKHRKREALVLLDEDDTQLVETVEQPKKRANCVKVDKIHYPSRDHPESVEISYKDIDCLAPESFLTSAIMNFYIMYLQLKDPPTNKAASDYHIFNTFFYKKLKQAVAYKGSDKESYFIKFRRWWKGVNIFQKAYLLIPIHEDMHWSLVIICIPDKEDESGPIILHLDSLGLHSSKSLFENIKSFLRVEWDYEVSHLDLSNAEKLRKLPRRIADEVIPVPQQRNDYDCGLFVLFFMERFIEGAPKRLKRKDLAMFGRQWFRPEEASGLRKKIRDLLNEKFLNTSEDHCSLDPPSSPDGSLQ